VLVKGVERLVQQMSEGDDRQHDAEREQRRTGLPSENHQRAGDQLDERDRVPDRPQRPRGEKRVLEREEVALDVAGRAELERLPGAGHEEDQADDETGE